MILHRSKGDIVMLAAISRAPLWRRNLTYQFVVAQSRRYQDNTQTLSSELERRRDSNKWLLDQDNLKTTHLHQLITFYVKLTSIAYVYIISICADLVYLCYRPTPNWVVNVIVWSRQKALWHLKCAIWHGIYFLTKLQREVSC